jgi:type IX secretion system PorP/SprF family membrane protein
MNIINSCDMKKILFTVLAVTIMVSENVKAQDPQFSQFYSNKLLLSPAFAGTGIGPRIALNYRRQWANIPGFYKTFAASYDMPLQFGNTRHGAGVSFMADQAGEGNLTKLDAILHYAYELDLGDNHAIRFGLAGGIQQASLDFYKLRFSDQIDPNFGFTKPTGEIKPVDSRIIEDISAGLTYFSKKAWLGANVNHITEPKQKFMIGGTQEKDTTKLPMKFSVFGGYQFPMGGENSKTTLTPAFLFKAQRPFWQLDLGMYVNFDPLVVGVWYRNQDAVIGLVGLKYNQFSFGYSYDYTISRLTNRITTGSHEISVIYEFEQAQKAKKMRHRVLPCPRF